MLIRHPRRHVASIAVYAPPLVDGVALPQNVQRALVPEHQGRAQPCPFLLNFNTFVG